MNSFSQPGRNCLQLNATLSSSIHRIMNKVPIGISLSQKSFNMSLRNITNMSGAYNYFRHFCGNTATVIRLKLDKGRLRYISFFPLHTCKIGNLFEFNHGAQIRYLFTEEFLGVSIFQQRQTSMEKEIKEQQLDVVELRSTVLEQTSPISLDVPSSDLEGNYLDRAIREEGGGGGRFITPANDEVT